MISDCTITMSFISNLLKNRQQIVNVLIVTISLNMYVQNERIGKQWSVLSINENQAKKDYDSYERMLSDNDWLEAVEERVIKSKNIKSTKLKNGSTNKDISIIRDAMYEIIPSFDPSSSDSLVEENTSEK